MYLKLVWGPDKEEMHVMQGEETIFPCIKLLYPSLKIYLLSICTLHSCSHVHVQGMLTRNAHRTIAFITFIHVQILFEWYIRCLASDSLRITWCSTQMHAPEEGSYWVEMTMMVCQNVLTIHLFNNTIPRNTLQAQKYSNLHRIVIKNSFWR